MRGPEADALLERALIASAAAAGAEMTVRTRSARRWESATFSGLRHAIEAEAQRGASVDRWLSQVPRVDLVLRGHMLADLSVVATTCEAETTRFRIEALTLATS